MKKCFLPIKMAAPMKRSTLQHNLNICTFNLWENDEKIKWISDLICMKHLIGVTMTNMEKMPSSITEACTKEISHIVYSLPVYEMINPDLLGAFQKKGSLNMLSLGTRMEVNNCVAFLPTGHLILHLTKESYTRLGLEGKPSHYNRYGGEKYVVDVDVGSTGFAPGKKNYERVKQCLLSSNLCCDFLVSWTLQDEKLCPSSISKYFSIKGFRCENLPISSKSHKYSNLQIPDMYHQETDFNHQEELYDWLGGVANQILWCRESEDGYNPLCDYTGPKKTSQCVHTQSCGFFSSSTLENLIQDVRQLCKSSSSWGCVSVQGFTDSVISIGRSEKNPHKLCADSVSLVILPNDKCWLFTDT
ncbi:ribonuclease P protein subunit p40-like isoform X1 [Crassostrea virginica]